MKTSALVLTETVKEKLLKFSSIVSKLQNKEPDFIIVLEDWIKEIETIFKNNNISESSELAGLRSKIIAPMFADTTRLAAKKKQWQVAAEILYDLQRTVLEVLKPYEIKVEESRNILLQLLGILKQTEAVKFNNGDNFQYFVNKIWEIFKTHEQLKPSTFKILSLISEADAQRIIAEEILLNDWQ